MVTFHNEGAEIGITKMAYDIAAPLLSGKNVTWLVSGGSNIDLALAAMGEVRMILQNKIANDSQKQNHQSALDAARLTITLIDERYGPVGHADSNWQQLADKGFFAAVERLSNLLPNLPLRVELLPVLVDGRDFASTAAIFAEKIKKIFAAGDYTVAQLGMGVDGHIAGILPHLPATTVQMASENLVCHYENQSRPHQRITLSFEALKKMNKAYLFAFGQAKLPWIEKLKELNEKAESGEVSDFPAAIIHAMPDVSVYYGA